MIRRIHELVSNMLGDETIKAISSFGKDTVHYMLDRIKQKLSRRGYDLDVEEKNNSVRLTSYQNGDIIKDVIVDRLKISDGEITADDLV